MRVGESGDNGEKLVTEVMDDAGEFGELDVLGLLLDVGDPLLVRELCAVKENS